MASGAVAAFGQERTSLEYVREKPTGCASRRRLQILGNDLSVCDRPYPASEHLEGTART